MAPWARAAPATLGAMLRHPNPDVLLRIAQADAYAAAVEYVDARTEPALLAQAGQLDRYLQHPTHLALLPGRYTDDTQMSIAVAEVLLQPLATADGDAFTTDAFATAFYRCFARDPRPGYARGFQALLEKVTSAEELQATLVPRSDKNGAAMRSVPLGVLADPTVVVAVARRQAAITHDTPGGRDASAIVALLSHFALHDERPLAAALDFCVEHVPSAAALAAPWSGPVGVPSNDRGGLGVGMCTAWAAHTLLVEETSLVGMMRRLVAWGGDTDSVAAIAWGIASARLSGEELPPFLEADLEVGGAYGARFLRALGAELMSRFG